MKKIIIAFLSMFALSVFATPYTLTIINNSVTAGLVLSSNAGANTQPIVSGTNTFQLDTMTTYAIKNSNQIFGTLQQSGYYFVLQETQSPNVSAWQNDTVNFSSSAGLSGSYGSVQGDAPSGGCYTDTGGITCNLSSENGTFSTLTITLTGGSAPTSYTYDAGVWDASTTYTVHNNPTQYPLVTYQGQPFVGCWYATSTNIPGQEGGPWKPYNPATNVCQ